MYLPSSFRSDCLFDSVPGRELGVQHAWVSNKSGINVSVTISVLLVPLDGFFESLFPAFLFLPSQFVEFLGVDGVSQIIEFTVRHIGDPLFFFLLSSKNLEEGSCDFNVGNFIVTSNVVDLSWNSLVKDLIKGSSNILDVQKITCVASISVDSDGHIPTQLVDKFGNEFLRELVWPIDIVSTGDQAGELETTKVRLDQKFCSSFGCRVGVSRFQNVLFGHGIGLEILSFSVNLIGGNMDKALDGVTGFGRLQEHVSSINVRVGKGNGVTKGIVHMSLGGKMQNSVNFLLLQDIADQIERANVSFDELEVGEVLDAVQVGQARAVVEAIVHHNVVVRILLAQQDGDMGSDESCNPKESTVSGNSNKTSDCIPVRCLPAPPVRRMFLGT